MINRYCPECGKSDYSSSKPRIRFNISGFTLMSTILVTITSLLTLVFCGFSDISFRMDWVLIWAIAAVVFSFFIILGSENSSNNEEKKNQDY